VRLASSLSPNVSATQGDKIYGRNPEPLRVVSSDFFEIAGDLSIITLPARAVGAGCARRLHARRGIAKRSRRD
jgi:hypothetical protein